MCLYFKQKKPTETKEPPNLIIQRAAIHEITRVIAKPWKYNLKAFILFKIDNSYKQRIEKKLKEWDELNNASSSFFSFFFHLQILKDYQIKRKRLKLKNTTRSVLHTSFTSRLTLIIVNSNSSSFFLFPPHFINTMNNINY